MEQSASKPGQLLFFIDKGHTSKEDAALADSQTTDDVNSDEQASEETRSPQEKRFQRKRDNRGRHLYEKPETAPSGAYALGSDAALEKLVFGDDAVALLDSKNEEAKATEDELCSFVISTDPQKEDVEDDKEPSLLPLNNKRQPAWEDNDDKNLSIQLKSHKRLRKLRETDAENEISGVKYEQRLRSQFEKLVGNPKWAELSRRREDHEDNINGVAGNYLGKSDHLPGSIIGIHKTQDINLGKKYSTAVKCVEFHPTSNVALTVASGNTFDLFQVASKSSQKIQSVFLEKFPITCAHFASHGEEVVVASERRHFYVYNMVGGKVTNIKGIRGHKEKSLDMFAVSPDSSYLAFKGNSGYIHVLSGKTKQLIHSFKMNTAVKNIAFLSDSLRLLSSGGSGEVYLWDIKSRRCIHKFHDDGCVKSTAISVSPNGQFIACGSNSGVVNIYDNDCLRNSRPTPIKTVMNLTTAVQSLAFNSTSEILALASNVLKSKIKLLHTPTMTVFQNWPSSRTKLGYVECLDFSSHSGFLSLGNSKGFINLYRLNHYPEA